MAGFQSQDLTDFFKALLSLNDEKECELFLEDICTIRELQDFSQRLTVAKMLREGKVYAEIAAKTGASTATISRVNRCLTYGEGGYHMVLDRVFPETEPQKQSK